MTQDERKIKRHGEKNTRNNPRKVLITVKDTYI